MKILPALFLSLSLTLVVGPVEPAHADPQREAGLRGLRAKLIEDGIIENAPKGVSYSFDASQEPEDGWIMVTVREVKGSASGGDPNVASAIGHFYIRESDGMIEWYDVVEDERKPYAAFVENWRGN
jgi:hypothetical protein